MARESKTLSERALALQLRQVTSEVFLTSALGAEVTKNTISRLRRLGFNEGGGPAADVTLGEFLKKANGTPLEAFLRREDDMGPIAAKAFMLLLTKLEINNPETLSEEAKKILSEITNK